MIISTCDCLNYLNYHLKIIIIMIMPTCDCLPKVSVYRRPAHWLHPFHLIGIFEIIMIGWQSPFFQLSWYVDNVHVDNYHLWNCHHHDVITIMMIWIFAITIMVLTSNNNGYWTSILYQCCLHRSKISFYDITSWCPFENPHCNLCLIDILTWRAVAT